MAQRLRSRATAAVAAGLAATCIGVAAAPAFADTVRNEEWWLTSLHVTKAWLSSRGAGVTVAVLDTGVDATQPDLAGSVTTGKDYTNSGRTAGGPFWGGHGTAVASLIAGHGHGPHHADGIMGVAPLAKILSVRVTLENKDPLLANPTVVAALPEAIARGINYAVRHGAQVIDLPLDPAAQAGGTTTGGSPAEQAAVETALRKGVVLVAPSGDNGAGTDTVNYPAAYPGVISVGAFGQGFVKAPFTNHRPYATLTAAGNGVIAANGPTGYAKLKSTSAASAVVAGMAALIRSQFPTLTPAQVKQALTTGTVFQPKGGQKDGSGVGTADAAAALLAAAKINATPTSSASPGSAVNPTPPAAPKVRLHTKSLWQAVRIPVLGPGGPGAARPHHPDHRAGPAAARARRATGPVAGCGARLPGAVGGRDDRHGQPRARLRGPPGGRDAGPQAGQQRARGQRPGEFRAGQPRAGIGRAGPGGQRIRQQWDGRRRDGGRRDDRQRDGRRGDDRRGDGRQRTPDAGGGEPARGQRPATLGRGRPAGPGADAGPSRAGAKPDRRQVHAAGPGAGRQPGRGGQRPGSQPAAWAAAAPRAPVPAAVIPPLLTPLALAPLGWPLCWGRLHRCSTPLGGKSAPGSSSPGSESRNSLSLGGWSLGKPSIRGGAAGRAAAAGAGSATGSGTPGAAEASSSGPGRQHGPHGTGPIGTGPSARVPPAEVLPDRASGAPAPPARRPPAPATGT